MNHFELMLILSGKIDEEAQKKAVADVKDMITKTGGTVKDASLWGKKAFTYPIAREKDGFYWLVAMQLTSADVKPVSTKIKQHSAVLRHLIIKKEK